MITLTNDFHGTSAKVRIEYFQPLSRHQERRIRLKLCPAGIRCNCWCGVLGQQGPNNPEVVHNRSSLMLLKGVSPPYLAGLKE